MGFEDFALQGISVFLLLFRSCFYMEDGHILKLRLSKHLDFDLTIDFTSTRFNVKMLGVPLALGPSRDDRHST